MGKDQGDQDEEDGLTRFVLTPKAPDALFATVIILARQNQISQLSIRDHSDQETVVLFRNYRSDVVLESEVFELDLPSGTDVIRG